MELRGNAGGAPFGSGAASLSRVSTLLSGSTTLEEISPPPALTSPGYAPLPKRHGDPAFDPVMELLNDRQAVVFVHPAIHPSVAQVNLPYPVFMMEFPFDTTRAAVNMLFNGTLERFPRIRIILAHAGGLLPYLGWRLSVSPMIEDGVPKLSREQVYAGLRRYWYDNALSYGAESMGALTPIADPAKILYGSDWPFADTKVLAEADKTLGAPGHLTGAQRTAIDRGNAVALFPRFGTV